MRTVDPAKHAAKRRAILDAAAGCFALEGFEKTSTAAICRAAGISSGSLFHYFPSKRAVFVGIFTEDTRDNEELLAAAAELDDAWAAVLSVVDRLAEPLVVPGIVRLVLEAAAQAARDPEFAALIRANDERMRVGLAGLVARGVEAAGSNRYWRPRTRATGSSRSSTRCSRGPASTPASTPSTSRRCCGCCWNGSFAPFRPRVAARCPRLVESVRAARPTTRGEGFGLVSQ